VEENGMDYGIKRKGKMITWLRKFFGLCDHKWNIIETKDIACQNGVRGALYILQCEKCGNVKGKQISV
jgi:hypothetical protein